MPVITFWLFFSPSKTAGAYGGPLSYNVERIPSLKGPVSRRCKFSTELNVFRGEMTREVVSRTRPHYRQISRARAPEHQKRTRRVESCVCVCFFLLRKFLRDIQVEIDREVRNDEWFERRFSLKQVVDLGIRKK
jgi:hypothetical protein